MNDLLQPDIQDVSNKMCANCDALICAGCPVFEMDKHAADLARIIAENIALSKANRELQTSNAMLKETVDVYAKRYHDEHHQSETYSICSIEMCQIASAIKNSL